MPGDRWQELANLRAYLAFMWAHPGKKLLFMGSEFAQSQEWASDRSLDWWLLQFPEHAGILRTVTDLNALYAQTPALWQRDDDPGGFEWIDANDAGNNTFSWLRRDDAGGLLAVETVPDADEAEVLVPLLADLGMPAWFSYAVVGDRTRAGQPLAAAYTEPGTLVHSGRFDGMPSTEAKAAIPRYLEEQGWGKASIVYRLRDWLVSRQRYWGAPIPMIYCEKDGIVPVPDADLPVELPRIAQFTGRGDSPLAQIAEFSPQFVDIAPEGYTLTNGGRIFTPYWTTPVVARPGQGGGAGRLPGHARRQRHQDSEGEAARDGRGAATLARPY